MTKKRVLGWALRLIFLAIMVIAMALVSGYVWLLGRGHGNVSVETYEFVESARVLYNPNRGFYHMHGFAITDEETDYRENVAYRYCRDQDTALTLVEINLRNYRSGDISETGLNNIDKLLTTLESIDKQLILRFCYDWNGENEQVEPEELEIILRHMEQVGPMLREHKDVIFTLQGLFIGNWGEMNGTRYTGNDDLRALARQLAKVTDEGTFLAVRMPAHWRKITEIANVEEVSRGDGSLASRLGLFNDGMLGSWSDYGTYGDQSQAVHGAFTYWNRAEELAFQDELCKLVPIGGEVIVNNEYNDFDNAVQDMAVMHVTYINRDYDAEVLHKWELSAYNGEGCFNGMDGLSYIERHLGYRLLIHNVGMSYDFKGDSLSVDVSLQNVGFAPIYKEARIWVRLYDQAENKLYSYEINQDIRELTGGNDAADLLILHTDISLAGEQPGEMSVFFEIRDAFSDQRILLANEQDPGEFGYHIGDVSIGTLEELWAERQNLRNILNGEEYDSGD